MPAKFPLTKIDSKMGVHEKYIFDFNHFSPDLTQDEVTKFKDFYKHYHKLFKCYQWKYKKLKRTNLTLQLASISLTFVGTVTGSVTLNPIIIGAVAGPGILIQGYLSKSKLSDRINQCHFAYASYSKILTQIRNFLRGVKYDKNEFLSDLKLIDDIVAETCPSVESFFKDYESKYDPKHHIPENS